MAEQNKIIPMSQTEVGESSAETAKERLKSDVTSDSDVTNNSDISSNANPSVESDHGTDTTGESSEEGAVFPDEVDETPKEMAMNDVRSSRILSGLGYLVFFLPLLIRNSKYARFHANQALLFLIMEVLLLPVIALAIVLFGGVGIVVGTAVVLVGLVGFTYGTAIYAMICAFSGKPKRIPLLGSITLIKGANDIEADELIDFDRFAPIFKFHKKEKLSDSQMEQCPMCHADILKGSTYCSNCGEKLL